jgi:phosphoribosylformylglycinamidine synthase subunit PurQ / glutaminase
MVRPTALIITGNGLNCEQETSHMFRLADAEPHLESIWSLMDGDYKMADSQILALIGGFADGDDLGAGTAQAARFRHKLRDQLEQYISSSKPIIAICNGFQTAVKMGILPGFSPDYRTRSATLMDNDSGRFEDRWVDLSVNKDSPCIWTKGIEQMFLPVRHGEGKFVADTATIERLSKGNQIVMRYILPEHQVPYITPTMQYPYNPNGSLDAIAGICDSTGTIFGLMPHPEAYHSPYNHPDWVYQKIMHHLPHEGQGVEIFRNAVKYVKQI